MALPVTGMTCASCAGLIEWKVSKLPGVHFASVSLATETLHVEFDPDRVDTRRVVACVRKTGFGVTGPEGDGGS
ncbi:MAG: cation transporter [Holophagales bacterium]|nr:cation transporter [Holophagales bacterium]